MNRFYYLFCEMLDDTWEYVVFDNRRGEQYLALCASSADAEKICDALNAAEKKPAPKSLDIFG